MKPYILYLYQRLFYEIYQHETLMVGLMLSLHMLIVKRIRERTFDDKVLLTFKSNLTYFVQQISFRERTYLSPLL